MTYYHLFDLQNSQLMETGRNSETLEKLKEGLLSYASVDYPSSKPDTDDEDDLQEWEDWQKIQSMPVEELAEMWQFSIEQTDNKI